MDIESLRSTLEQASIASLAIGLAVGFLFSFNPVALAAIPVSLAYVTKAQETRRAVLFASMFVLGMILTHVVLGLAAALGGAWIQRFIGRQWGLVLGPLLIVMGFVWPGWIKLPLPQIPLRARRVASSWGALAFGASFSVAVCPACTPALVVLLGIVAGVGSPLFGVLLLFAFALGRTIPVVVGAAAVGWLESLRGLRTSQKAFETAGGVVLILTGLYMLNAYYFWIPELAA